MYYPWSRKLCMLHGMNKLKQYTSGIHSYVEPYLNTIQKCKLIVVITDMNIKYQITNHHRQSQKKHHYHPNQHPPSFLTISLSETDSPCGCSGSSTQERLVPEQKNSPNTGYTWTTTTPACNHGKNNRLFGLGKAPQNVHEFASSWWRASWG